MPFVLEHIAGRPKPIASKGEIAAGSLDQRVADEVYRQKKEKEDAELQKAFEKQVKLQSGEGGFRGMIKGMGSGFSEMIDAQKTMGDRLKDIGSAFSDDLSFLGDMMSPLASLPGMNLAMTIMKTSGQALLSLGTKEGRARAREAIDTAKMWVQQKAEWVQKRALALKTFIMKKAEIAWNKVQAVKKRLMERRSSLRGDKGSRLGKKGKAKPNWMMTALKKMGGVLLGLVVGFFVMIGAAVTEIVKPFQLFFSSMAGKFKGLFKGVKLPKGVTKGVTIMKSFFAKIGTFFKMIMKPFKMIGSVLTKLANPRVIGFMKIFGSVIGKLFWPITVIMGAWEFLKGFIAGFKSTEGGFGEKIIGGIYGGLQALVDWLIMWPLDLIKDLIVWVGEKLGFDMSILKGFSFQELWKTISDKFIDGVMAIVRFVKAIAAGIGAGIMALWPGGEGPMEAFKRKYDEVMASPGGGKASTIEKPEASTGQEMETAEAEGFKELKGEEEASWWQFKKKRQQGSEGGSTANIVTINNQSDTQINVDGTTPNEKTADNGF